MTGTAMLHGEGTIAVEIQFDGVTWIDVTADVMYDAKVNITMGRADETSQAQPAGLTFVLLNTAGNYTPFTPASIYFPNVKRNTPIRVRFDPSGGFKQLWLGYAVGFTPVWDTSAKKATVNVVAAGTLRRLTQGKTPLQSALVRQELQYPSLVAFWPLDDGSSTTIPSQLVPGGPALTVNQPVRGVSPLPALPVVFGAEGQDGVAAGVDLSNGGFLKANVVTTNRWTVGFAVKIVDGIGQVAPVPAGSGLPPGSANIEVLRVNLFGGGSFWFSYTNDGLNDGFSFLQLGYDHTDPTLAFSSGEISTAVNDGRWHYVTFTAERFTNIHGTFDAYATQVDNEAVGEGFLLPGDQIQPIRSVSSGETFEFGDATTRKFMVSGLMVASGCDHFDDGVTYAGPLPFNQAANISSFFGWAGETDSARITRLCGEQGVPITITGSSITAMGVQPVAAFIDILRECETTGGGVLYDGFGTGLGYICLSSRYNLTAAITADMSTGQVAPAFTPVDDDQRNRNDVTVSRSAGSTARAIDSTGTLGTAAIGVYDTSLTVNTQTDDPLVHIAEWNVGLGTVQGLRYPTLPFDLVATTALISPWLNAGTISFRTDVTNVTSKATQHPPGTVSVIVEGYSMVLDLASWTITANCSPFAPWRVFKIQDATLGRIDTGGSVLHAGITNSATTITVDTSSGPLWTTTGGAYPFDVEIAGEQITLTAAPTGSPTQTFTSVTRSVNGVVKAHLTGDAVKLWHPAVLAL